MGVAVALARILTGEFLPQNPQDALIFQNALLLIVLGSAIIEHKFTKPGDSVVNGLMGMVTLLTVFTVAPKLSWWWVWSYCCVTFVLASVCVIASTGPDISGLRRRIADVTYRPAVLLGRARVLYSVVFLYAVLTFYGFQSPTTGTLVLFWGVFVALWPLRVPALLSALRVRPERPSPIGRVIRSEWPDLVRVKLEGGQDWRPEVPRVYLQANGEQRVLIPLYEQAEENAIVATGLCGSVLEPGLPGLEPGFVYALPEDRQLTATQLAESIGGDGESQLIGYVVEGSTISELWFETWMTTKCKEGALVWCKVGQDQVFYQVAGGATREETLGSARRGYQVASAAQLGRLETGHGFRKHLWLPPMNTPVFMVSDDYGAAVRLTEEGDFSYGVVPGTALSIGGPFAEAMDFHTAILGVTGSGKTELAFDLIRHACEAGLKVLCIDITAKYAARLSDLAARNLSVAPELSAELSEKLFAVETGTYGAGKEKQALQRFATRLRDDIRATLVSFLEATDNENRVGIVTLEEISNTKATIFATELFLTTLLHYARDHPDACPPVLVVVEEAHTVIPETSTMGLGDYDSRGMVGKIAQVALQGRKYGVGLLVIAQRTATVSKTVLTQCNTMITFNCFDETSLGFLKHVFGATHTNQISDLPPLHAVIYGRGVRSERPVLVEIPFDENKVNGGA